MNTNEPAARGVTKTIQTQGCTLSRIFVAIMVVTATASASENPQRPPAVSTNQCGAAQTMPPFKAFVDTLTLMEHVITPAADRIWLAHGTIADSHGERDLTPVTNAQWESVVTGAATLAEATNAMLIPQRAMDPQWNGYVEKLAAAAEKAWHAAEAHDVAALTDVADRLDGICSDCHKHYGAE